MFSYIINATHRREYSNKHALLGLIFNRTITIAIDRYTINIAEDIRDIKNKLEDDREHLRSLTRQLTLRLEAANERDDDMRSTVLEIDDKLTRERENGRGKTRRQRWLGWVAIAGQSAFQITIQLVFTSLLTRRNKM
jgi:hypothetical protein